MARLAAALAALAALSGRPAAAAPRAGAPAPAAGYGSCLDRGQARAARGAEARPRPPPAESTARERELGDLADWAHRFEDLSREYRQEIQLLVEKKYDERRRFLSENYEQAIKDLEVLERKERQDAIAQFEEFLSRYPDDPGLTPDAMFRL
ncbi:MAG TPA: hypothetical protein VFI16_02335, partial [Anaeromyxobacteraceae bacterium]|nr:hypothetical protein [Anaeromyxobacteraceae bacterium]